MKHPALTILCGIILLGMVNSLFFVKEMIPEERAAIHASIKADSDKAYKERVERCRASTGGLVRLSADDMVRVINCMK